MQKFAAIWYAVVELQWDEIRIKFEMRVKTVNKLGPCSTFWWASTKKAHPVIIIFKENEAFV